MHHLAQLKQQEMVKRRSVVWHSTHRRTPILVITIAQDPRALGRTVYLPLVLRGTTDIMTFS